MTLSPLPREFSAFLDWTWSDFAPHYAELEQRELSPVTVDSFLRDWSDLSEHADELLHRLYAATTSNTADTTAEERYHRYLDDTMPPRQGAEQRLREKLLASGLEPAEFALPLRKMRAETDLFRAENVQLLSQEARLGERFNKIVGGQTVEWEGGEIPLEQLQPTLQSPDRARREAAWRSMRTRQLADRVALNDLWHDFLTLRSQLAANAGMDNYREFRWQELLRFDYTPEDCLRFDGAIEEIVVPAAVRLRARRRNQLGVETLRPWDDAADPLGRAPLQPYADVSELVERTRDVFQQVDPAFGDYFATMHAAGLLDLASRMNKAPGGYCETFPVTGRPFIFMNAAGVHEDVQTLLHEGGHAFHVFESNALPLYLQRDVGLEFAEVASMAMELLAAPYLGTGADPFYTAEEAARARIEHLEGALLFWPYMAVVDLFQHWVYEHPAEAVDPANCDRTWTELYTRYHPDEDWSGLEDELATGWQRKPHIFDVPFYYVEYGLARLGAVQVWANARRDRAEAVARYRHALSLGGTRSIPELYAAAGAQFSFSTETLAGAVELIEKAVAELS